MILMTGTPHFPAIISENFDYPEFGGNFCVGM